jgi:hypothetical protein
VDAAKSHVESLNPLVAVKTVSGSIDSAALDELVKGVDLVCVTDWTRDKLVSTSSCTRCPILFSPQRFISIIHVVLHGNRSTRAARTAC